MELTNSKRLLYTASYVTTQLTPEEQRKVESEPGGGVAKANLLRALELSSADIERLQASDPSRPPPHDAADHDRLLETARKLAADPQGLSTIEMAKALAPMAYESISRFMVQASAVKRFPERTQFLFEMTARTRKISPIGRIHLERIEMYSAGVQKGELVFTVPMAPGETIRISHKEWSTSTREFEEIVQDYFESYSERGVAEKSDASMSSENESKHASTLSFGASLSGSYAGVTLTTTLGLGTTNEERQSVKHSMQKSREVTEKASARTRQEHKVSVKIESTTATEDASAKTIANTAAVPVRLDYYRMMRKWRTDLFRYGLRQTYDIAIPLPGVRIWAWHRRLAELDRTLRAPFTFALKPDDLTDLNWTAKAIEFGALAGAVPPPPKEKLNVVPPAQILEFMGEADANATRFGKIDFEVPEGYWLENAAATAHTARYPTWKWMWLNGSNSGNMTTGVFFGDLSELRLKQSGKMTAVYEYRGISFASLQLLLVFARTPDSLQAWKRAAWGAIKVSAEARHQELLARLQEERDRLWSLLNGKDTLSLRRLEREELMRLVMQWILGPTYPVMSTPGVQATIGQLLQNETSFQTAATADVSPTFTGITEPSWYDALMFGEFVKFMHQAIEWENLLYFLYPYFWGAENLGRDKLLFEHGDSEHERFLRAGYVRIVLPVRPGFEEDFTHLVETGTLSGKLAQPYMPVAQEIANFARTNYAGIPPANPEAHARPLLFPEQRATWDTMQKAMQAIDQFKADHGKYPDTLADLPSGSPKDAWGNELEYRMPGLGADYDLVSLGADNERGGEGLDADISSAAGASLVATWFDYTPTSALDIEMDTKPADIA